MAKPSDFQHKRRISQIDSGETESWASSDGGSTWHPQKSDTDGRTVVLTGLVPHAYDHIALGYSGDNLTEVVYRTGGVSGDIVATLALVYDGSNNLTSVTKT